MGSRVAQLELASGPVQRQALAQILLLGMMERMHTRISSPTPAAPLAPLLTVTKPPSFANRLHVV